MQRFAQIDMLRQQLRSEFGEALVQRNEASSRSIFTSRSSCRKRSSDLSQLLFSYQTGKTTFDAVLGALQTYRMLNVDYYEFLRQLLVAEAEIGALQHGAIGRNGGRTYGSDAGRCAMKRAMPWIVAAIFAAAFVVLLIAKRGGASNEINGVTQDASGRRVTAWIDPMYSQGPPHIYKSNEPGRAPDCGMKLVPVYADATATTAATSTVAGYANVSVPGQRQQLIGVKLATAELRDLSRTIRTTGRVAVDERRHRADPDEVRRFR